MSYQVKQGNIFGRIGKGLAQGLSEQLPKEMERTRLSEGLKELGKEDLSGKNQLELLGAIHAIPGMTPEIAALAQQQLAKQNYQNKRTPAARSIGEAQIRQGTEGRPEGIKKPLEIKPLSEGGIASVSQIKEMRQGRLQAPSYEDVYKRANELLDAGITQDPQAAESMARSQIEQDRIAQKERIASFRNDAADRLKLDLQSGGFGDYKDVAGEIQKNLIDQGEYLLSQGVSPEDASQQIGDIARELGKISNNTKDTGSFWNMFRSAKTKTQELKEQKKNFEKYGFGELFDDIAAGQLGITPLQAAHELDPLKNKALKDEISKLKRQPSPTLREVGNVGRKMDEKSLDAIVRKITPKDNLFSIEYELRDKGYDVNQFKKRVSELEDEKELSLTPQQQRQQRRDVGNQFFGDILYQTF